MSHRRTCVILTLILALAAAPARGQAPELAGSNLSAFPGAYPSPSGALSAARALADTWLGESPFGNPASPIRLDAELSAFALRIGRQDLRAENRNLDETAAFFGGGGVAVVAPVRARLAVLAYAWRPEARFEETAFTQGNGTDPSVQPALIQSRVESRETRAGLGAAFRIGSLRAGAAVELTRRNDLYRVVEQSGSPTAGSRELRFDGTSTGWQAGLHWTQDRNEDSERGRLDVGAGVRRLSALDVSGEEVDAVALGGTVSVDATREAGWEGGASAAYAVTDAFRVLAGAGGRSAQAWAGFGVESGAAFQWAAALDYHDARDPWGVHFGVGRGTQDGADEPSAGIVGLGIDWRLGRLGLTAAVAHRGLHRDDAPTSSDDRFFIGVRTSE